MHKRQAVRVVSIDHKIAEEAHARLNASMSRDPAQILESMETTAERIWDNTPSIQMDRDVFVRKYVDHRMAQL